MTSTLPASTRKSSRTPKPAAQSRDDIVQATRELFAERSIARTSISAVAQRLSISRGLIYYYFPDKDALTDAVLADYIADFVESVRLWDAARTPGDIEQALRDCITMFRRNLFDPDDVRDELYRMQPAALYTAFMDQAVQAVVDCISESTVRAYAALHQIQITHVRETFYVLVYGLVGLMRSNPAIDDEVLVQIVRQTLYLPGGPTPPGTATPNG